MPLLRNSQEHIDAVAQIDLHYNRRLQESKRDFLVRHPGMAMDECEEWLSIQYDIESHRQYDFEQLRKRIIDPELPVVVVVETHTETVVLPGAEGEVIAEPAAVPTPELHV